ncbi:hypothetical protein [Nitrosomonas communis]|uniref:Uncharacterized protein n=1 Tax=Nitrosomonas communis TaxID=44574 RepID=A0A1I4VWS5_9PROT|nr:hypothetical protein [Nitrosomonas communis]SFN05447.1 hypothetical protein SAMN05421863_10922 [Nitrosomonas communis]
MISHNVFDLKSARITLRIIILIWLGMSSAVAELPTNDDFATSTIVTEPLPFINAINTSKAITAKDDPYCSGQESTVWQRFLH